MKKIHFSSVWYLHSITIYFYFLIAYLAYLNTKYKNNFIIYYLFSGIFSLLVLNEINFFQNLNNLFSQMGNRIIHFNLIPVISFGTLFNNGLNNNFLYYLNFETLEFYKPEYFNVSYSYTVGVFNKEASLAIEKVLLLFFCIKLAKMNQTFIYHFLLLSTLYILFLTSYFRWLLSIFGINYSLACYSLCFNPCFALICSQININISSKFQISINLVTYSLLLVIPLSIFIWTFYNPLEQSYNKSLKDKIIETNVENQLVLIPIEETNYSYHYGFQIYMFPFSILGFYIYKRPLIYWIFYESRTSW